MAFSRVERYAAVVRSGGFVRGFVVIVSSSFSGWGVAVHRALHQPEVFKFSHEATDIVAAERGDLGDGVQAFSFFRGQGGTAGGWACGTAVNTAVGPGKLLRRVVEDIRDVPWFAAVDADHIHRWPSLLIKISRTHRPKYSG